MWHLLTQFLAPKKFFIFSNKLLPWLGFLFLATFSYGLIGGLIFAPGDAIQGDGFRIIYVHVPCAFLSLFIYAVMTSAAIVGLVWRVKLAFAVIRHSIPIGACFTLMALITGSIWGKPMWGTWWIWDARLTSELILLFLYSGIYLFQLAIAEKRFADRATAILILVGSVDIPIIHYSVNWWNTLHQGNTLKLFSASSIDDAMLYPLLAMIFSFFIYYAIILFLRLSYDLVALQNNSHWLRDSKNV